MSGSELRNVVVTLADASVSYGPIAGKLWVSPVIRARCDRTFIASLKFHRDDLMTIGRALRRGHHAPAWCHDCGGWTLIAVTKVSPDNRKDASEGAPDRVMRSWPTAGITCRMTPRCQGRMFVPDQLNPNRKRETA